MTDIWNNFFESKHKNEYFLHSSVKKCSSLRSYFSSAEKKTSYAGKTVYNLQDIHSIQTAAKR